MPTIIRLLLLGLVAGCTLPVAHAADAPAAGPEIVATPELRREYLAGMLRRLCTELGPRPIGSESYNIGAAIIREEMARSLPQSEFDRLTFDNWQILDPGYLIVGDRRLDFYPFDGSPSAPEGGIAGTLVAVDDIPGHSNPGWAMGIRTTDTQQMAAYLIPNSHGPAITRVNKSPQGNRLIIYGIGLDEKEALERSAAKGEIVRAFHRSTIQPDTETMNVVATLPGATRDEILILAHLDTHFNTPGANDNTASAIALVMLAHELSRDRLRHTVRFVATAGEEVNKVGSYHYAARREAEGTMGDIKYCFNFDSLTWGPSLNALSNDEPLRELVGAIGKEIGVPTPPTLTHKTSFALDEKPFFDAGARTIYFNSVHVDGSVRLWHRPEDLPERVDPETIEHSVRVIAELVRRIDRLER